MSALVSTVEEMAAFAANRFLAHQATSSNPSLRHCCVAAARILSIEVLLELLNCLLSIEKVARLFNSEWGDLELQSETPCRAKRASCELIAISPEICLAYLSEGHTQLIALLLLNLSEIDRN